MAEAHGNALRNFDLRLKACTVQAACGREYVLGSKLKGWLVHEPLAPHDSHLIQLHQHVYPDWEKKPVHLMPPNKIVSDNCVFLFCILLEMRLGSLIHQIWRHHKSDEDLPINLFAVKELFAALKIPDYEKTAVEFDKLQWKYAPARLDLYTGWVYHERRVMPFRRRLKINEKGATAQLWQIEVLEDFVSDKLKQMVPDSVFDPKDGLGPVSTF